MKTIKSCSGRDLVDMFSCAAVWLERNVPHINSLNVFPVPDGDTGINMSLTMRSAVAEASQVIDGTASDVIRAISHGALMGARGNSGVILSQILRGLTVPLDGKARLEPVDLVTGLSVGSSLAYKAVSHPVEGTILTVVREAAEAAQEVAEAGDICKVVETITSMAKDSVARTPLLLDTLREAGVVDAGGLGLYVIFEGFLRYLRGEKDDSDIRMPLPVEQAAACVRGEEISYGYCTEFVIEGPGLDPGPLREHLETIGESVMVVKHDDLVRAHVHTFDPGAAIGYATTLGTLRQVKIQDMDEQHRDLIEISTKSAVDIATVAVVQGDGIEEVFRSLGATAIVLGGQTMNPSTQELLEVVESVPSDKVILLPNNSNIVLSAEQVTALTEKRLAIVPTETMAQGVAALLALNNGADFGTNVVSMREAMESVRTIEITTAVRDAAYGDLRVKEGQTIALLDGELTAADDDVTLLVNRALSQLDLSNSEVITVYHGADVDGVEAAGIADEIRRRYAHLEVESIYGGQPHYSYIISVE
ncbi:MAG: DAK2 domain-containing protein [Chloroflexota bacterium]|nr:DAK2 domain-containing protein [Chloroflexota bacterium]